MLRRLGLFARSNLIGLIALFFALSGVATALPGVNTVDSGDIKNNVVTSADIKNGTITATDLGPSARVRWARVSAAGPAIVVGRGATGVTHPAVGVYQVTFAAPVNSCGWSATRLDNDNVGGPGSGEIAIIPVGANVLNVVNMNSAGTNTDLASNVGFTLTVNC